MSDLIDIKQRLLAKVGGGKVNTVNPVWPVIEKGLPVKDHPENLSYMMREIMNWTLRRNQLSGQVEVNGVQLNDSHLSQVRSKCRELRLSAGLDFVNDTITIEADKQPYHPFKEEVERVKWDGTDHIEVLFQTLIIQDDAVDNRDTYRLFLKRWLVGVVAKVYQPGSQNMMLVLQGPQGIGKSRWSKRLGLVDRAFGEGAIDPDNKDHELRHLQKVVWHIPELDAVTRRRDVSALKDFLTKEEISCRAAYARHNTEGSSILSFVGSVNSDDFLVDQTGNRRFLVLPVKEIVNDQRVNMQQVYAQAYALYLQGERWWFDTEEIAITNKENEKYEAVSWLDELVANLVSGDDLLTMDEIIQRYSDRKACDLNSNDRRAFGRLMSRSGFEMIRVEVRGIKLRKYRVKRLSPLHGMDQE